MRSRQIFVDVLIVACLVGVAVFCYNQGKAYDVLIDNRKFVHEGQAYPAFEAVEVFVDDEDGEPMYLVDGDRGAITIAGQTHVIVVKELDKNDQVTKTYRVTFKNKELKGRVINVVPLVRDKLPGWSYTL
ncbi:MAG: hypothetical protein CSA35_05195 [Dethiosulfovibrio peptidovorans]|nr:MAG: hypothetical protein CSA35_05195 [Dethiosulfovibrio peptidovorans]